MKSIALNDFLTLLEILGREKLRWKICTVTLLALTVTACTQTSVQPMSKDTFKIDTSAAPACGPAGARNVAFEAAAIEVIRQGGDKFIIQGDRSKMDGWSGTYGQGMIVKMIPEHSPEASNALSARETLGADWRTVVQKGVSNTCT
ncbi:hypothetical protein [Roseovarius pacificus]|uniref:hypothetical protein n=1 Tax=Roseovarius pacificus TaxID=337701 RepID=UPI004039AC17